MTIVLSDQELGALTGYTSATKQLNVLHARGFTRAFINRLGAVVLERAHYEAVSRGEMRRPDQIVGGGKVANLDHFRGRA